MQNKIILLNGPAKTGKTELANHLIAHFKMHRADCKIPLHKFVMHFFNIREDDYWKIYLDREKKEEISERFIVTSQAYSALRWIIPDISLRRDRKVVDGKICLSLREAMIYVSEVVYKPTFGDDYFGVCRAKLIGEATHGDLFIDDSAGFDAEVPPLKTVITEENTLLIRIYRDGCEFGKTDSRGYLASNLLPRFVDIFNTGSLEEFLAGGLEIAEFFIKGV